MAKELGIAVDVSAVDVPAGGEQPAKYLGSPTILIDGRDLEPAARTRTGSGFG